MQPELADNGNIWEFQYTGTWQYLEHSGWKHSSNMSGRRKVREVQTMVGHLRVGESPGFCQSLPYAGSYAFIIPNPRSAVQHQCCWRSQMHSTIYIYMNDSCVFWCMPCQLFQTSFEHWRKIKAEQQAGLPQTTDELCRNTDKYSNTAKHTQTEILKITYLSTYLCIYLFSYQSVYISLHVQYDTGRCIHI